MHELDIMLKLQLDGNHDEAKIISDKLESLGPDSILDSKGNNSIDIWYRHRFNRGWFLLRDGDFQAGYQYLEAGRHIGVYGSPPLTNKKPIYNPNTDNLENTTVVLRLEGGLGDQIMYVRFAKSIKNLKVSRVIVTCDESLVSILSRVDGVDAVVANNIVIEEDYDYWIPGFSAGWLTGTTYDSLSGEPYLSVDSAYKNKWRSIVNSDKPKIGLKWFGNKEFEHQQFRRFPLAFMNNLDKYSEINLYSLQMPEESPQINGINIISDKFDSWEDTLAAIDCLDLVITSCTSIAHAAAALGKQTWVLVPALPYYPWVYDCPDSTTSPYYSSVKLFRQTSLNSWNSAWQTLYTSFENLFNLTIIEQPNEDIKMRNLNPLMNSYDIKVDCAYIITISGNETSEQYSKRCQQSCESVGMQYKVWEAFDGTKQNTIKVPSHSIDQHFFKALKISNHYITRTEIAATLSHISLWLECARLDKPIVILEHDAIMLRKFSTLQSYNSVVYLGGTEWYKDSWPELPIPPFGSDGPNHRFILRAHAYAIDPPIARNLLAHVLKYGVSGAPDYLMRADLFNITHQGLYAYDDSNKTTISNRNILIPSVRNDDLSI